ncbi:hypothetical protein Sste5346_002032 [Sporothrix stenoceras]|uniref:Uncharacterized protein n=1 Tax=Sporothrix stenoceras TaxID=5173 RepID=A0ABR3ZJS4_9PEZI
MATVVDNPGAAAIPDWSQLNFARNCSAYGEWLAAFVAPNPWNPEEALGGSIPLTVLLVSNALPPGWTFNESFGGDGGNWSQTIESPAGTAYFGDVMQWFTSKLYNTYNATDGQWYADPSFVDNVIWTPADQCPREFCKAIAFTGNADLSGIGVVISYYIEASLTTLYLIIFTAWRIKRFVRERRAAGNLMDKAPIERSGAPKPRGRLMRAAHRLFDALRGSLDSFLMAAGVLGVAILVAALVMEASHTNEHRHHPVNAQNIPSGNALYDSALGLLAGLYAVFPPVVLYALLPQEKELHQHRHEHPDQIKERKGRRTWLRRAVLIVLWGLAAAVVFCDPRSELDYEYQGRIDPDDGDVADNDNFASVLYACDQRGGRTYWLILESLKYLIIGVPVLWLVLTLGVYLATGWRPGRARATGEGDVLVGDEKRVAGEDANEGEAPRSLWQRIGRPVWRHFVAWVACLIMWTILLSLTEMRQNIIDVAGGLDTENEWAIGQVLAIATWGPVAVDFGFLLIFGIEAGLGGRLPLDFTIQQVVSTSSVDSIDGGVGGGADAQATGSCPTSRVNSVNDNGNRAASAVCRTSCSNASTANTGNVVGSDKTAVVLKDNREASSSSLRPSLRARTSASSAAENGQPSPMADSGHSEQTQPYPHPQQHQS